MADREGVIIGQCAHAHLRFVSTPGSSVSARWTWEMVVGGRWAAQSASQRKIPLLSLVRKVCTNWVSISVLREEREKERETHTARQRVCAFSAF